MYFVSNIQIATLVIAVLALVLALAALALALFMFVKLLRVASALSSMVADLPEREG